MRCVVVRRTAREFLAEKQVAACAVRNQRHEIDGYRGTRPALEPASQVMDDDG
jgi:hypothetical protein